MRTFTLQYVHFLKIMKTMAFLQAESDTTSHNTLLALGLKS
jgi:hypothetical protein